MNAVAEDTRQPAQAERIIPGRERSWIDAAFRAWGEWLWSNRHFEGYPTTDHITAFIMGRGGDSHRHRVLCRDMPPWIRYTHAIWLMLPDHEALVVWAEFVPGVEDDGRLWTQAQKCERLKISIDAYKGRLSSARGKVWDWSRRGIVSRKN